MTSVTKIEDTVADSTTMTDLAVQPITDEGVVTVDGPTEATGEFVGCTLAVMPSNGDSIATEQAELDSPFGSWRTSMAGDAISFSIEEGDERDTVRESTADLEKEGVESADILIGDTTKDEIEDGLKDNLIDEVEIEVKAEVKDGTDIDIKASGCAIVATEQPAEKPSTTGSCNGDQSSKNETNDIVAHGKLTPGVTVGARVDISTQNDTPTEIESRSTTSGGEDDVIITDGETTAVEEEESTPSPPRVPNVPPHLRPGFQFQVLRTSGLTSSRFSTPTLDTPRFNQDVPRYPRHYNTPNAFHSNRDDPRDEIARTKALLMKTRNDLDSERHKNANMRKTITAEQQQEIDAALSTLMASIVRSQASVLAHQARVDAHERTLTHREKRIEQLEIYLSEGQKQLYFRSEAYANPTPNATPNAGGEWTLLADMNRDFERRMSELEVEKRVSDLEAKIAIRAESLRLREAALKMREEQYVSLMRKSWEDEVLERPTGAIKAKLEEVAQTGYERGFEAGKYVGRKEVEGRERQRGFLEGYEACFEVLGALKELKEGRISGDSGRLGFLFEAGHPHNLFVCGRRIGGMGGADGGEVGKQGGEVKQVKEMEVDAPVQQPHPQRPTFASELRNAQKMNGLATLPNGTAVNGSAVNDTTINGTRTPSQVKTPKINGIDSTHGVNGNGAVPCVGGHAMAGVAAEKNLIDLD